MQSQRYSLNKFTAPDPSRIYQRDRLNTIFDATDQGSSFWISGPGGSGKSTLVASHIRDRNIKYIWYNIDAFDADPSGFFYYLNLAAEPYFDQAKTSLPMLTPEYMLDIEAYMKQYYEIFFQNLPSGSWLIFDNLQDASLDSPTEHLIEKAISMAPRTITIVVISRHSPPPTMARFYANRTMTNIDFSQIAFTRKESDGLVKLLGYDLERDEVDRLFQFTHGWVAGIILWVQNLNGNSGPLSLPIEVTPEIVFDYFSTEIFERLDDKLKHFLIATAILPYSTAQMAHELTGLNAEEIFEKLTKRNAFVEKKQLAPTTYQYHPLFREYLLSKGKSIIKASYLKKLAILSAQILVKNDIIEDGVELYIEVEEYSPIIEIIVTQAPLLISHGRHQLLVSWINALPPHFSRQYPWLCYWKGVGMIPESPPAGHAYCIEAYKAFSQNGDFIGQVVSWSTIAEMYLILRGEFTSLDFWIPEGEKLAESVSEVIDIQLQTQFASSMLIAIILRQPSHPDLSSWQKRCEDLLETCDNEQLLLSLVSNLSLSYQWFGQVSEAKAMLTILRPLTNSAQALPIIRIGANAMLSGLLLALGELKECQIYSNQGLKFAKKTGIHIYNFLLYCTETYVHLLTDKLDLAEQLLDKLQAMRLPHAIWENGHYHFQRAWLNMQQGDLNTALIHINKCLSITKCCGNPFTYARSTLLKSQLLLEEGDVAKVQDLLSDLVDQRIKHESRHIDFTLHLVLADCAYCEQELELARQHLTTALSITKKYGFLIPAGLKQERLSKLAEKALKWNIHNNQAVELIKLLRLQPPPSTKPLPQWPWPVQIYTSGRIEIKNYGEPVAFAAKSPRKPLELLRFLVVIRQPPETKEQIADYLWPDSDGDRAIQSFNITLHRLRKLLGYEDAVILEHGRLYLNPDVCWVDAWEEQVL